MAATPVAIVFNNLLFMMTALRYWLVSADYKVWACCRAIRCNRQRRKAIKGNGVFQQHTAGIRGTPVQPLKRKIAL
jgi:hypothetical protein